MEFVWTISLGQVILTIVTLCGCFAIAFATVHRTTTLQERIAILENGLIALKCEVHNLIQTTEGLASGSRGRTTNA